MAFDNKVVILTGRVVRTAGRLEPDGVEAALTRFGKSHPLGRIGTGQDIANVLVFLARTTVDG